MATDDESGDDDRGIVVEFPATERSNRTPLDPLGRALGVEPMPLPEPVVVPMRDDGDDYQTARVGLHDALGKAGTALLELMDVARVSQHPRSYEVLNQMLKTIMEGNEQLLQIAERQQKLRGSRDDPGGGPKTINNTLVVTSTQMLDMIKKELK